MKITKPIQHTSVPLYRQLLALIPLLKVIEEGRKSIARRTTPLSLDVTHRSSGELNVDLTPMTATGVADDPVVRIFISGDSANNEPLRHRDAYVFAWSYLCSISTMNDSEQAEMHKRFMLAWASYVIKFEDMIKATGLE